MPSIRAILSTAAGVLLLAAPAHAATLFPAADLGVSAAQPTRNFGTATRLVVTRRPAQRAFVRFALGAAPRPGTRIELRLYALLASKTGVILRHASDRPWNERAITYRTAPRSGPRLVRSGPLARRRWARIDVTQLVDASGVVALSLTAAGAQDVEVASREAGARYAPRLVVTVPAPRPGLPVTLPPPPPPGPAPEPLPPAPVDPAHPCGVATSAPRWDHVVWLVMENKSSADVMGSAAAPYLNALAGGCAWATQYTAIGHPSLPNYIAMTSGDPQGITDDSGPASHPLDVPSLFSQLGPGGWRALEESMPAACSSTDAGDYVVRHNPATYYTNIAAACATQDVPLSDPPDLSAPFTFVMPNLCSSTHSCSVATGDLWLSQWVPRILSSPQYRGGTTALFVTYDENGGGAGVPIPTIVVAPSVPSGLSDAIAYTHYSLLRTTEEMLRLPLLGGAQIAPSMRPGMHL
jgi:phosphatidylinositol-3-phosphatase